VHERCKTVVEPLLKLQWWVRMAELAKPALEAYTSGAMKIMPERQGKVYVHWLENIKDWCISRQLWWGHRIPVYYCPSGHFTVSKTMPQKCAECDSTELTQDEDTLDTWFSSALWPFSTLGWPKKTPELDYFYPSDLMVTAYDILFFWVIRMVFAGMEEMKEIPFKTVLFHGLIRNDDGSKMSKSSHNTLDPIDIVDEYGADALRLTLINGNSPTNDARFYKEKVESNRNFLNKIWNATRFMLMNMDCEDVSAINPDVSQHFADKWILSRINTVTKQVTLMLDSFELGVACAEIYNFVWDELCDWYIEMIKPRLYNHDDPSRQTALHTLHTVLVQSLKLLHPFIPFITEEIFTSIQTAEDTIMLSKFPEFDEAFNFAKEEQEFELFREPIKVIRSIRIERNVPPSKKTKLYIYTQNARAKEIYTGNEVLFRNLCGVSELEMLSNKQDDTSGLVSFIVNDAVMYLPLAELIDISKERERLNKELGNMENEIKRAEGKLSNKGFVEKAPQKLIDEENEKKRRYEEKRDELLELIDKLPK
jgi:valyl-tRNA synthetase